MSRWGQSVENLLGLIGRAGRIPIVHHEDLVFIEMIQAGIDCCRNDVLAVVARNDDASFRILGNPGGGGFGWVTQFLGISSYRQR